MKISKLESLLLALTAVTLAFFGGWYAGSVRGGADYTISVERSTVPALSAAQTQNPAPGLLEGELININTAPAADLERLPGIGEKRARDIVDYRNDHGPFKIVEEITNVTGIGEGTLRGLIDYITVGKG